MNDYLPPKLISKVSVYDHSLGNKNALVTIVEYGDYQCPHCGYLHQIIKQVLDELGSDVYYIYRHFPLSNIHVNAQLAAEAAEAANSQGKFWEMHNLLFENQQDLSRLRLTEFASQLELDLQKFEYDLDNQVHEQHVKDEFLEGVKSGVNGTPALYINGSRYDGAWDLQSVIQIIKRPLGIKIQTLANRFTDLAVSGGILLFLFTIFALLWANSTYSDEYFSIWKDDFVFILGNFRLEDQILGIINDGLMVVFFFVVGLEIKRELIIGELSDLKKAMLPIFAALGGMIIPALFYIVFNFSNPQTRTGWAIPMATDIAFMLVILSFLRDRIPLSLRIFFSALAIVDDLGAILVISILYTSEINFIYLIYAGIILLILFTFNRLKVNRSLPYAFFGILLWFMFLESGVHPTIAGVLLAMTIPIHPPPNTPALIAQCTTLQSEYELSPEDAESKREAVVQTLEIISDRLQSPAQRLEHEIQPWTTYLILPIFALANAGIVLRGQNLFGSVDSVMLGITIGLVIGKPFGIILFSWFAVKIGIAQLPSQVTWSELISISWLAGIGFTMSLFIANIAFNDEFLIATAKFSILLASLIATLIGLALSFIMTKKIGVQHSGFEKKLVKK